MRELIKQGMDELSQPCSEQQISQIEAYLELLCKWNKAYNLTAITDRKKMVVYHALDSAAIVPYVVGENILDVGTGAGLPGMILAILSPHQQFTLLDSNGKKTRFLQTVVRELKLENVIVLNDRIEKLCENITFDCITSRAFASLSSMIALTSHVVGESGIIVAMKGPKADQEIIDAGVNPKKVVRHTLQVPFMPDERQLLILQ